MKRKTSFAAFSRSIARRSSAKKRGLTKVTLPRNGPSTDGLSGLGLRTEYKLQNGYCELEGVLSGHPGDVGLMVRTMSPIAGVETNHIWSLGRRPDVWTNLIDLHPEVHRWFHRELTLGRVACLYAKWRKGGRDWDVDELDAAAGKSVLGWLECVECDEFFGELRDEILKNP